MSMKKKTIQIGGGVGLASIAGSLGVVVQMFGMPVFDKEFNTYKEGVGGEFALYKESVANMNDLSEKRVDARLEAHDKDIEKLYSWLKAVSRKVEYQGHQYQEGGK